MPTEHEFDVRPRSPRLTPLGKRAEARLATLQRRQARYGFNLDRLSGADDRDRLDNQITAMEGRFADETSAYWVQSRRREREADLRSLEARTAVRAHPRKGTRGVRRHERSIGVYVARFPNHSRERRE